MILFSTSSVKISNEALELFKTLENESKLEKICQQNNVFLASKESENKELVELSGNFNDLISVHNNLSSYLKRTHGISTECVSVGVDADNDVSDANTCTLGWVASDNVTQDSLARDKTNEASKVPEPIVLSFNLKEFTSSQQDVEAVTEATFEYQATPVKENCDTNEESGEKNHVKTENDTLDSKPIINLSSDIKTKSNEDSNTPKQGKEKRKRNAKKEDELKKRSKRAKLSSVINKHRSKKQKRNPENDNLVYHSRLAHDESKEQSNVDEDENCSDKHDVPLVSHTNGTEPNYQIEDKSKVTEELVSVTQKRKRKTAKLRSNTTKRRTKLKKEKSIDTALPIVTIEDKENGKGFSKKNAESCSSQSILRCPEEGCKYVTKENRHLTAHVERSHVDLKFKCSCCDMRFAVKKNLLRHEKSHGNPQHCCTVCGKIYRCLRTFLEHKKSHEEGYVKPEFLCNECGKAFSTKYVLQYHIKSEHLGIKKSYLCPTCGKSFTQKNSYLMHANVHLGIRPFVCEICGDSFPYEKSLKEHKYKHDDIRRFQCNECGKSFRQPSALHTHMKIHSKSKEHLCGTCGKGFTQKQALLRHERIHSGDKPFSCNLCGRTFSDASIIRRHMIMVHKIPPSEWRSEVTSEMSSNSDFFVEMLEGDKQPQLKKRGRPVTKPKSQVETDKETTESEKQGLNIVEVHVDSGNAEISNSDMTRDSRANAALTLSSLAAGGLVETIAGTTSSKANDILLTDAANFLQKQADHIPPDPPLPLPTSNISGFASLDNVSYTNIHTSVVQPNLARPSNHQAVMFSNFSTSLPSLGNAQVIDKNNLELLNPPPPPTFQEAEESGLQRSDQWASNPYPYMYLPSYSQFQQIQ